MSTDFVSLFTGMSERDIGYLLKNVVQRSINDQLTSSDISNVDNKTPVLITNSKDVELLSDLSIYGSTNIEAPTTYTMTEEPDGNNLRIWLKFENAGELRDWSYQKNKSFSVGANTMPGLFIKDEPNSMLKHELYSYFNGNNHYGYSADAVPIRITPIIAASKTTSFFMRFVPISLARLYSAQNNVLFTKVDDDQLRYGYSVTMDQKGGLHFYVKNNYRQYHLWVKNAYASILTDPMFTPEGNFQFENFKQENFPTDYGVLCNLVDAQLPFDDWFFKYNPTTHNMVAIKTGENNPATALADSSTFSAIPIISCPLQEGKWTHSGTLQTTVYDASGNNRNATINNLATGGQWDDDNTLINNGGGATDSGGINLDFGSISAINNLTEFTIAFWYNPLDQLVNPGAISQFLFTKGGAYDPHTFTLYRRSGFNELVFNVSNATLQSDLVIPNAFPHTNRWYFIVAKWKTGERPKLSIDNSADVLGWQNITGPIANAVNNLFIFYPNYNPKCKIALFKFYDKQITQAEQDDLYLQGYHNPLFPKSENIQPEPEEEPDPILIPFSTVYFQDKMGTPTAGDYRKINSVAGDSPLVSHYDVADGSSTVDPELNPYTIADGTGGAGSPFVRIGSAPATIDSSNNSNGTIGSGQNNMYGLKITATDGVGIGDTMIGKVLTKAIVWMRKTSAEITGTLYFRIWNATDTGISTPLATLGSVAANTLTEGSSGSEWYPITFQNTANTVALADGYRIGVEYQGFGSGDVVNVQRRTPRPENTTIQTTFQDDDWNTNPDYTMKCDLYTGLGTTSSDPNIIMKSGSYNGVVQAFGSGDALIGKNIGKVTLRLKKVGSPTGTASICIYSSSNTITPKAIIGTLNVSTLTTSTADYTFTNYIHGYVPVVTDRIGITWTPSASGEVHVMSNLGNTGGGNTWNGTNSSVFTHISTWSATGFTTVDLAGKIYIGGNNFDAYIRTSETVTRIAVKAVNNQSDLHNKKITKVVARIKKVGSPAGVITCRIRDPSDTQRVLFSSVDVNSLTTSYTDVVFENYTHTYLMNSATGSGDKVVFEYSGSSSSNYLEFNMNHDLVNTSNLATIVQYYNGNYVDQAQYDMAGEMYSGGEPDLNSRTRVAQSIEHQDSILKGKKITRVKQYLYRTNTSVSGTVYCNIRRGSDDALIKSLGAGFSVSSLSSTASNPTFVEFTDTTNNYPMGIDDKISIEFSGGNTTDQVGVLVRSLTPTNYDGSLSFIRKYNEVDWDDQEGTYDLCATMNEGGFLYTPDPGSILDPTPVNDKDLIYLAGNNKVSGFLECFLMEFRIYSKDITLDNADYLFDNRYSISAVGRGEILMPLTLKMNTTDPV